MTPAGPLFRTLWRVNAVVVLVAGLLVSAAAVIVIVAMVRDLSLERGSHPTRLAGSPRW
jgi:hypothetical protein